MMAAASKATGRVKPQAIALGPRQPSGAMRGAVLLAAASALWACATTPRTQETAECADCVQERGNEPTVREFGHPRFLHGVTDNRDPFPAPSKPVVARTAGGSGRSSDQASRDVARRSEPQTAAKPGPGTVAEAITASLGRSARVRGASVDLALAGVNINIARSGYLPTLQGNAGVGAAGDHDMELTLSQTIYDWGRTGAQVRQARSQESAAELALVAQRERTALEAAQSFIEIKRSTALVRSAQENVAALERISSIAAELVDGGVVDSSQVDQANVNLGEARASLEDARGVLRNAMSIFAVRTGLPPESVGEVPELALSLQDISDTQAAARGSPAVAAQLKQGEAARDAADVARAELLPRVSAEGFVRSEDRFGNFDTGVGVRLTSPTFVGFSNFQRANAATLQAGVALHAAEAAMRDAEEQVLAFKSQAPTLRGRQTILTTQLASAKALRNTYEDQFKVGDRTVSDLINAQADVYRIERGRIAAQYDILDLQYAAAAALGRLQELSGVASSRPAVAPMANDRSQEG